MNRQTPEFDQRIADWLESDPNVAPPEVLATVGAALPSIQQARRGRFAPWRFSLMNGTARLAATALVAVVAIGGAIYLLGRSPGFGGPTPIPATPATVLPTNPAPTPTLPPGITGWTAYTSAVYGFTMAYPSGWSVYEQATQAWPSGWDAEEGHYADVFLSPSEPEEIALQVWEMPVPVGVSLASPASFGDGLAALCQAVDAPSCEPPFAPTELCLTPLGLVEPAPGVQPCWPALITQVGDPDGEIPHAFVADPGTGDMIVFQLGRDDASPGITKYGSAKSLLSAIVGQLQVR